MHLLFDYDSFIYQSVYKVCGFTEIRKWFQLKHSREWMEKEIVLLAVNRLHNMKYNLFANIEETGIDMESVTVEYYVTTCRNSVRKRFYSSYKANRTRRPMDKWVSKVRQYLINDLEFTQGSDDWEADDLIADRARELGQANCLILSLDKDLKQIGGFFFDYYTTKSKEMIDEYGNPVKVYRGLSVVSKNEAERIFWISMLTGDRTDNIEGIKGIGPVNANKLLNQSSGYKNMVRKVYWKFYGKEEGIRQYVKNYRLLYLGKSILNGKFTV